MEIFLSLLLPKLSACKLHNSEIDDETRESSRKEHFQYNKITKLNHVNFEVE